MTINEVQNILLQQRKSRVVYYTAQDKLYDIRKTVMWMDVRKEHCRSYFQ